MYEEFCLDAGLGEPVRLAIAHAPKDAPLLARARDAVGCKNQKAFQEACKEGMDRHGALFPLVALAECYPLTKQYFPDTRVRRATLGDIAIWVRHYAQKTGGIGVEHYRWLSHHACGTLVRLGRLQYEEAKFPFSVTIVRTKGGRTLVGSGEEGVVVLAKGMPCLFVHIPEGSPLDVHAVDDSLVQARDWFPDYPVAVCVSWLLDPALSQVLPPDARIIRFQKRFTPFLIPEQGEPQIFERVFGFGITKAEVRTYRAVTSLQKRVQEALAQGVGFHTSGGFIVLSDEG